MAAGFRSYQDVPGSPVLTDMTMRISQMLGFVDTGGADGTITVPDAPTGKSFFYVVAELGSNPTNDGLRPGVTLTDNGATVTISWAYSFQAGWGRFAMPCRIHYGFF